jgi:hypothetical protein
LRNRSRVTGEIDKIIAAGGADRDVRTADADDRYLLRYQAFEKVA